MEYSFSSSGSPAADAGLIGRFPLLDPKARAEQRVGDQMADPNSLLYFPSLHENQRDLNNVVQDASSLAVTFDEVVRDERDEAADFAVFGRVLLVALALVELTISFADRADMTGHGALVAELRKRIGRDEQLGLIEETLVIAQGASHAPFDWWLPA